MVCMAKETEATNDLIVEKNEYKKRSAHIAVQTFVVYSKRRQGIAY